MASYPAIAATSQAVLGLLQGAAMGSNIGGLEFAHSDLDSLDTPLTEGLSLHLYRITIGSGRNQPARVGLDGVRRRPPIPLDLHYLLIAWAGDAVKQQRLLGWAVRVLEDTPVLPAGVLNQHTPEPDVFRPEESVELVWENVGLEDWLGLWNGLSTRQPSATYVVRGVMIDSEVTLDDHPLVQTRELDMAGVAP
jgi:hypothetical protein